MWSHLLACALLLLPAQALAGAREKLAALAPSGLVLVMDQKGNELVVQNADKPFVPASVAKIVTAWLAMEVLGADYRFQTRFYLDGDRVLYIRGGGDPFLISEELAQLASALVAAIGKQPVGLPITHIRRPTFASSESTVILFVTPNHGGVPDERGCEVQRARLVG